jgi:murein L,D-transpeptidase YcbB/YkuD
MKITEEKSWQNLLSFLLVISSDEAAGSFSQQKEGLMARKFLFIILVFGMVGCASTQKQSQNGNLQMRVDQLEKKIGTKDDEIKNLESEVRELSYNIDRLSSQVRKDYGYSGSSVPTKPSGKDGEILRVSGVTAQKVQKALQLAGYYKGTIDGKLGTKTNEAIRQFQKDHSLKADGVIGQQTWAELRAYLK